jgi:hypothetical protein
MDLGLIRRDQEHFGLARLRLVGLVVRSGHGRGPGQRRAGARPGRNNEYAAGDAPGVLAGGGALFALLV